MNKTRSFRLGVLETPLEKRAEEEGVDPSKIMRRALKNYLVTPHLKSPASVVAALSSLRSDLAKVGGNLNQIAMRFNMDSTVAPVELSAAHEELRQEFNRVMSLLRYIEKELKKDE